MADGSLARRYAKALVALAREDDIVDVVGEQLARFGAVLDEADGALRRALENPGLTTAERRRLLDAVLERLELHRYVANFLRLVVDKNRFAHLPAMVREYRAMADEIAGRVRAEVTTARPLDDAAAAEVRAALERATGRTVVLTRRTDPSILGGIVARVGDVVYDASVRGRLDELGRALGATGPVAEA